MGATFLLRDRLCLHPCPGDTACLWTLPAGALPSGEEAKPSGHGQRHTVCLELSPRQEGCLSEGRFGCAGSRLGLWGLAAPQLVTLPLSADKQIDLSTVDLKKLRVKELKKILDDWGETCKGCAEKSDYIRKIHELMPKYAPKAAGSRTDL